MLFQRRPPGGQSYHWEWLAAFIKYLKVAKDDSEKELKLSCLKTDRLLTNYWKKATI